MKKEESILGSGYYDQYLGFFDEWILQKQYLEEPDESLKEKMIKVVFSEDGKKVEKTITLENFDKFEQYLVRKGMQYSVYEGGSVFKPSKKSGVRRHYEHVLTVTVDFNDGIVQTVEIAERQFRRLRDKWIKNNYGFTAVDLVGNIVDKREIEKKDASSITETGS